jgi:hypothetical protein
MLHRWQQNTMLVSAPIDKAQVETRYRFTYSRGRACRSRYDACRCSSQTILHQLVKRQPRTEQWSAIAKTSMCTKRYVCWWDRAISCERLHARFACFVASELACYCQLRSEGSPGVSQLAFFTTESRSYHTSADNPPAQLNLVREGAFM